ncbi:hypothetical protein WR25_24558 [Diploscapter pachys]|uniref:Uncharacterized protein n=1 Tax=Diploscapter pachys TaxID=2018661 RepID=A0A2A2KFT9_9BILA|nr:hypothetical protein WR25_24558 [Diploscapter pachys]
MLIRSMFSIGLLAAAMIAGRASSIALRIRSARSLAGRINLEGSLTPFGACLFGIGFGYGLRAKRTCAGFRSLFLSSGGDGDLNGLFLRALCRCDHCYVLVAIGDFRCFGGSDTFLGADCKRARFVSGGRCGGLFLRLLRGLHSGRDARDLDRTVALNRRRLDRAIARDRGGLDHLVRLGLRYGLCLGGRYPGNFGEAGLFRFSRRDRGGLLGAARGKRLFLKQPRLFGSLSDLERLVVGFQVSLLDRHSVGRDDIVAGLLALLNGARQHRQTFGIESVVFVEMLEGSLVEMRDRHRLQLHCRQADLHQLVKNGDDHDAAVQHHLFAAKTRSDQRDIFGRTAVKTGQDDADDQEGKQHDACVDQDVQ